MSDNNFLQISTDYKSEGLNFAISKWCNKVVFKLCVVEFCSEILLLIPKLNQTCAVHSFNFVWFQTKLHSTQFNYHYKYSYTFKCSITTWTRWHWHCKDRRASGFCTYPITNDGTLTNICGQRKSNLVILRPHALRIQLDVRKYHENLCFRGHEK